ncbi:MAG TPA: N-acetylmuramoyl-L-alanine amidase [Candidatus Eisenbacteria bacterium]|nr:N-acetylmuramoyl-L-alanine amidase [Candidatus Eisenbacteria bacterium]
MKRAAWIAVALALGAGALTSASDWRTPPPGEGPETVAVRKLEGRPYIGVNDLARLIEATKFWRADVRRLVLRTSSHTIVLTADNPFVVVDDRTFWLADPVRSQDGEFQVPVALVDSLPSDSTLARLIYDARRSRVVVLPVSGGVGSPRVAIVGAMTRMTFPADHAEEAVVVTRGRARFRLRFGGVFVGSLPDSIPAGALVTGIRTIAASGGSAFELAISPAATGYRLIHDPDRRRVVFDVTSARDDGFESFATETPPGERALRVVVIDPAHGGADAGVVAGAAVEKDLALDLARRLAAELEQQGMRVVLTRNDDRSVPAEARAALANRLNADLVLALHFDGYVDPRARGATAFCPPATVMEDRLSRDDDEASASAGATPAPGRIMLLPWRDVATRHAVQSRDLAEAVLSALELRGQGPTRLRERLPYDLLGVNAPGILLECATLTAPGDRDRVLQEEGMRQLAASIAEGVSAYRRSQ